MLKFIIQSNLKVTQTAKNRIFLNTYFSIEAEYLRYIGINFYLNLLSKKKVQ